MAENLKSSNYKKALLNPGTTGSAFGILADENEEDEVESEHMDLGNAGNAPNPGISIEASPPMPMEQVIAKEDLLAMMDAADSECTMSSNITGKIQVKIANSQYIGDMANWTYFHAQTIILHGIPDAIKMKDWKLLLIGVIQWTNLPIDLTRAIQIFQSGNWRAQTCAVAQLSSIILPLTRAAKFRVAATRPDFPLFLNLKGRRYCRDSKTNQVSQIHIPNTVAYQPISRASIYGELGNEIGFLRGFPTDDSGAATEAVLQLCNQYFGQILNHNQFIIVLRPVMTPVSKSFEGIAFREYIGVILVHPSVNTYRLRDEIGIMDPLVVHTLSLPGFRLLFGRELSTIMKTSMKDLLVQHVCTRINNVKPTVLPWTFFDTLVEEPSNAISFRQLDFYYVETDYHISHPYIAPQQLAAGVQIPVQGHAYTLMSRKGQVAVQFLHQHQQRFAMALDTAGRLAVVCFELPNWEHQKRCYGMLGGVSPKQGNTQKKGNRVDHMGFTIPKEKKESPARRPTLKLKAEWVQPHNGKVQMIKDEIQAEERRMETISVEELSKEGNQLMKGYYLLTKYNQRSQAGIQEPQLDRDKFEWELCHPNLLAIINNCTTEEKAIFETVLQSIDKLTCDQHQQQLQNILQLGYNLHRQMELEGEDLLVSTEDAVLQWIAQHPQSYREYQQLSIIQKEQMELVRIGRIPNPSTQGGNQIDRDRILLVGTRLQIQSERETHSMEGLRSSTRKDMAQWKKENPGGGQALEELSGEDRETLTRMAYNILELMDNIPKPCPCPQKDIREGITHLVLLNMYKDSQSPCHREAEVVMKQWADNNPQAYQVLEHCIAVRQDQVLKKNQHVMGMMGTPTRNTSPMKRAKAPPDPPNPST